MIKFRKVLTAKIISLLITGLFLINSTVYGIDLSDKSHLRVYSSFKNPKNTDRLEKTLLELSNKAAEQTIREGLDPEIFIPFPEGADETAKQAIRKQRQAAIKDLPKVGGFTVIPISGLLDRIGDIGCIGLSNAYGETVIYLDRELYKAFFADEELRQKTLSELRAHFADENMEKYSLELQAGGRGVNHEIITIEFLKKAIEQAQKGVPFEGKYRGKTRTVRIEGVEDLSDLREWMKDHPTDAYILNEMIHNAANATEGCDVNGFYKKPDFTKRIKVASVKELTARFPLFLGDDGLPAGYGRNDTPNIAAGKAGQLIIATKQHEGMQRGKIVSLEQAVSLINSGDVIYVEFENLAFFDNGVIEVLKQLKSSDKKLIVRTCRAKYNKHLSLHTGIINFLSSLEIVDYVVVTAQVFSLKETEYAFRSNVYFISEDINAELEYKILHSVSPFRSSYKEVEIRHPKYLKPEDAMSVISRYQEQGLKVGIITGVFDVLHDGHSELLKRGSKEVDILIILINSDLSASLQPKNIEGDRPIKPLGKRIANIGELAFVKHIIPFDSQAALPLLRQLSGVVFIKTEKDRGDPGIDAEMAAVRANGGTGIYVPVAYYPDEEAFISTTAMVTEVRASGGRDDDDKISYRDLDFSDFSELAQDRLNEAVGAIARWDEKTSQIFQWRELLRGRYEMSIDNCIQSELKVLREICNSISSIMKEFEYPRDYHYFIIPYILGEILQLHIRIVPLQDNRPDLPTQIANVTKLSDGRVVFFDTRVTGDDILVGPLAFQRYYEKDLPHHMGYKLRDSQKDLPKRVFIDADSVHALAISLKIVQEEYEALSSMGTLPLKSFELEMEQIAAMIWERIEGEAFYKHDTGQGERKALAGSWRNLELPTIVAHRGSLRFPENSRSAIIDALDEGADVIELDVVACKDGWIVFHDQRVDHLTDGEGMVDDMDIAELKSLRLLRVDKRGVSDERIMTLSETLDLIASYGNASIKIDVKYSRPELEPELLAILRRSGLSFGRFLMTSEMPKVCRRLHRLDPDIPFEFNSTQATLPLLVYGLMDKRFMPKFFIEYLTSYSTRLNATVASLMQFAMENWGYTISQNLVAGIQQAGLDATIWVIGSPRDFHRCIDLGASSVMIHDPETLRYAVEFQKDFSEISNACADAVEDTFNTFLYEQGEDPLLIEPQRFIEESLARLDRELKGAYDLNVLRMCITWFRNRRIREYAEARLTEADELVKYAEGVAQSDCVKAEESFITAANIYERVMIGQGHLPELRERWQAIWRRIERHRYETGLPDNRPHHVVLLATNDSPLGLEAALASALGQRNSFHYDRYTQKTLVYVVIDDSRMEENQRANTEIIKKYRSLGLNISFWPREQQESFVKRFDVAVTDKLGTGFSLEDFWAYENVSRQRNYGRIRTLSVHIGLDVIQEMGLEGPTLITFMDQDGELKSLVINADGERETVFAENFFNNLTRVFREHPEVLILRGGIVNDYTEGLYVFEHTGFILDVFEEATGYAENPHAPYSFEPDIKAYATMKGYSDLKRLPMPRESRTMHTHFAQTLQGVELLLYGKSEVRERVYYPAVMGFGPREAIEVRLWPSYTVGGMNITVTKEALESMLPYPAFARRGEDVIECVMTTGELGHVVYQAKNTCAMIHNRRPGKRIDIFEEIANGVQGNTVKAIFFMFMLSIAAEVTGDETPWEKGYHGGGHAGNVNYYQLARLVDIRHYITPEKLRRIGFSVEEQIACIENVLSVAQKIRERGYLTDYDNPGYWWLHDDSPDVKEAMDAVRWFLDFTDKLAELELIEWIRSWQEELLSGTWGSEVEQIIKGFERMGRLIPAYCRAKALSGNNVLGYWRDPFVNPLILPADVPPNSKIFEQRLRQPHRITFAITGCNMEKLRKAVGSCLKNTKMFPSHWEIQAYVYLHGALADRTDEVREMIVAAGVRDVVVQNGNVVNMAEITQKAHQYAQRTDSSILHVMDSEFTLGDETLWNNICLLLKQRSKCVVTSALPSISLLDQRKQGLLTDIVFFVGGYHGVPNPMSAADTYLEEMSPYIIVNPDAEVSFDGDNLGRWQNRWTVETRNEEKFARTQGSYFLKEEDMPEDKTFVFLEPHEDDLVIGFLIAIIKLLKKNNRIIILGCAREDREQLRPIREAENRAVFEAISRLTGAGQIEYIPLGLQLKSARSWFDGKVRYQTVLPHVGREEAIAVLDELEKFRPDYVVIPDKRDHHPEHVATWELGVRAIDMWVEGTGVSPILWTVPLYSNEYLLTEPNRAIGLTDEDYLLKQEMLLEYDSQQDLLRGRYFREIWWTESRRLVREEIARVTASSFPSRYAGAEIFTEYRVPVNLNELEEKTVFFLDEQVRANVGGFKQAVEELNKNRNTVIVITDSKDDFTDFCFHRDNKIDIEKFSIKTREELCLSDFNLGQAMIPIMGMKNLQCVPLIESICRQFPTLKAAGEKG